MDRKNTGSYIWSHHEETPSERKLAQALKKARIPFDREVAVKNYSVDFLLDQWLVVEVDGESHLVSGQAQRDKRRQKSLEDSGFYVLRVPAAELSTKTGLKKWINTIVNTLKTKNPGEPGKKSKAIPVKKEMERKKALEYGKRERERKTGVVFDRPRSRKDGDEEETMADYFTVTAADFQALLDKYDWENNRKKKGKPK